MNVYQAQMLNIQTGVSCSRGGGGRQTALILIVLIRDGVECFMYGDGTQEAKRQASWEPGRTRRTGTRPLSEDATSI